MGDQLPTEEDLQKQHSASRGTVRRALDDLEADRLIERIPAKGTFVRRGAPLFRKNAGEILSFQEQLSSQGIRPENEVLRCELASAGEVPPSVGETFGIPRRSKVISIRRLRRGNGVPFAIQQVYLLPRRCPGILEKDISGLMRLYEREYGVVLVRAEESLKIDRPSSEDAKLLGVSTKDAVLIRDRVSFDQQLDEPFEILRSIDKAGIEYHYSLSGSQMSAMRLREK